MCYIGKASKIFIFLITVLVITGIVLGFNVIRRTIHPSKSHQYQCSSDDSCSQSDLYPPPPFPNLPISSTPDPNASDPSDLYPPPPPPPLLNNSPPQTPSSGATSNISPPPPPIVVALPPSESIINQTPPPPVVSVIAPPPPVVIVAPPPVIR